MIYIKHKNTMKKSILFLAILVIAISAKAQNLKESEVPASIKNSFTKLHPNAKVDKWEKEGSNYEAEFTENKIESSVDFGPNGQFISSEVEINVSALPKAAADYCTKNMTGKKIKEASKITDKDGKVSFEAEVDGADYIFDANGTFVNKVVEKDTDKDDKK